MDRRRRKSRTSMMGCLKPTETLSKKQRQDVSGHRFIEDSSKLIKVRPMPFDTFICRDMTWLLIQLARRMPVRDFFPNRPLQLEVKNCLMWHIDGQHHWTSWYHKHQNGSLSTIPKWFRIEPSSIGMWDVPLKKDCEKNGWCRRQMMRTALVNTRVTRPRLMKICGG